ncbi:MAG: Holliday junction resolvase RuvX [Anaerolineae bacterium]|nr:Holliday junction resolvase RuvX [Anaerolineae bacterium]
MTHAQQTPGRVMALDLGEKRIGIAISDPTRTIASPHLVLNRKSRADDFARYNILIENQAVTLVVVGLPITLGGEEGQRAAWVRDYAEDLGRNIDVPIVYWDESLTTVAATEALHAQGRRGRKLKERLDAVAAALILQSYLDAHEGAPSHDE